MNENKTSCAPADNQQTLWDRIDWTKAELAVRKLQARIVKAQKEGRYNKVKALQWTLTHSFYAKALAVKRVTSNGGGNTPGVVPEADFLINTLVDVLVHPTDAIFPESLHIVSFT